MKTRFRGLLWLAVGLFLGVALGLYLGWVVAPLQATEAEPGQMEDDYRREYGLMVAHAYLLDGDLTAARRRLHSLDWEAPDRWLLGLAVDTILDGRDEAREILPLVRLAHDLGLSSPAMDPYLQEEDVSQ